MTDGTPATPAANYAGGDVISTPAAAPATATPAEASTAATSAPPAVNASVGETSANPLSPSSSPPEGSTGSSSPTESVPSTAAPTPAAPKPNGFQPSLLDGATPTDSAQPAEAAADAAKPSEAPGETPPAPVKYEFTYPEGFDSSQVNQERMSAYTGILGEAKVNSEYGQKLLDLHLQEINTAADKIQQRQWDVFNETQNRWRGEVMADPELGGDKHGKAITTIMSLVDQYGGNAEERKGLLDAFRITGAANNPHVLRFMHRAAQSLSKEAVPTPAPSPRMPQSQGRERGLSRYRESTPFKG